MKNDFIFMINESIKDNKRDLIITDREFRRDKSNYNRKWYKYSCNKCGWTEGWIIESSLKKGRGCGCCCNRTAVLGINTIWDTDRWMCDLGVSEEDAKKYTKSSKNRINVICPNCGNKKDIYIYNIYKTKSIGCVCGDSRSYLSKYILNVLKQLDVKFDTEVKYDWNKYINPKNNKLTQAYIDFVIYKNNAKIPLEADGEFHRSDSKMTGLTKKMAEYIDKQRDANCLKNLNEKVIRITNEGNIKLNILNSQLSNTLDLSEIDWNLAESFAMKNLIKEVCNYWNIKNEHETIVTVGEIFGINRQTTRKYLKLGSKMGWCDYNAEIEKTKKYNKMKKINSKKVIMYLNGNVIGVFESTREIERLSEKLFGVKLSSSCISGVCRGIYKQHKGYVFSYI